jgi:hypothetical protein
MVNSGRVRHIQPVNNDATEFLHILNTAGTATRFRGVTVDTIDNLGTVTVTLRTLNDGEYCPYADSGSAPYARRCYEIEAQNNLSATVRLWALTSELDGIAESNLAVYHYEGSPLTWTEIITGRATGNDSGSYSFAEGDTSGFSPFLLGQTGNPPGPTAVTLAAFTAEWANEQVVVRWETVLEIDTVGFNLWRSTAPDGAYERVSASLIPAVSPGQVMGGTYEYIDDGVTPGETYLYRLEEVEVGGDRNWYGPVSIGSTPNALVLRAFAAVGRTGWLSVAVGIGVTLIATALGVTAAKRRKRT